MKQRVYAKWKCLHLLSPRKYMYLELDRLFRLEICTRPDDMCARCPSITTEKINLMVPFVNRFIRVSNTHFVCMAFVIDVHEMVDILSKPKNENQMKETWDVGKAIVNWTHSITFCCEHIEWLRTATICTRKSIPIDVNMNDVNSECAANNHINRILRRWYTRYVFAWQWLNALTA